MEDLELKPNELYPDDEQLIITTNNAFQMAATVHSIESSSLMGGAITSLSATNRSSSIDMDNNPAEDSFLDEEDLTSAHGKEDGDGLHKHKSIGMWGSVSIAVNSLAGPALLQLPFTYQQAGIIPTTFALIFVAILSSFCCMHTADVVSKVPGNKDFCKPIEFSDPYRIFWSHKAYLVTQILFYCCTICVNIAATVDTAQIVDSFLGHWKGTWGFAVDDWEFQEWIHNHACSRKKVKLGRCLPFASANYGQILLSLGYIITAAVFMPLCLMDLKENTAWQVFGLGVLLTISVQFVYCFISDGLSMQHVSLWGESWDSMLGVILFNFALVMAIPAWLSEKKPSVSVSKVVYGSTILSTVLYILVGLLGAMAIPNINANALAPMVSGAFGPGLRMGASLFAFFIVGLDIPLFSVLTRYNLTNSGLCSPRMANILVVYLPWSTAWMFYQGSAIDELLSWGGILFTSAVAFLLPLYLAIRVLQSDDRGEQPGSSSIQVYGDWISSKRMELVATVTLFVIAFAAVVTAIVGQALYDQQQETLLRNDTYVNSTIGQVDAAADDPDL